MEDNITEKFALLNLIKALQGISTPAPEPAPTENTAPPEPAPQRAPEYNAMANVLERHEAIANRVKNKK